MLDVNTIQIQSLKSAWWKNSCCDVLRLDRVHPVVSGNKWFKLRYYLEDALAQDKKTLVTFGGAWSNHIVATAFAARQKGLKSTGIIRGEKPPQLSGTLQEAMQYGMELVFVSRESYRDKEGIRNSYAGEDPYWIDEGGYGRKGMMGAKDILQVTGTSSYTHILCACGTGTTLAGLVQAALPHQWCMGISVLKGHTGLADDVNRLLGDAVAGKRFEVLHDYHFGGYAKNPPFLTEWMNALWRMERLPTDIVYTGKLMYAVKDLVEKKYFTGDDRLLVVHSGGLQGNRSLPPGTLKFP